jgi:hypothetical protein
MARPLSFFEHRGNFRVARVRNPGRNLSKIQTETPRLQVKSFEVIRQQPCFLLGMPLCNLDKAIGYRKVFPGFTHSSLNILEYYRGGGVISVWVYKTNKQRD